MIVRMKNTFRMLLAAMLLSLFALPGYSWQKSFPEKDYVAYLFTYFTGNSGDEEAVRYAVSMDGYTYWALNDNEPVIDSKVISSTGGVRDPHILRCEDGKTFYMVVTDMVSANGWSSNRAMVLLKSTDLVNWSHSVINIQKRYSGQEDLKRVWAPQTTSKTRTSSSPATTICRVIHTRPSGPTPTLYSTNSVWRKISVPVGAAPLHYGAAVCTRKSQAMRTKHVCTIHVPAMWWRLSCGTATARRATPLRQPKPSTTCRKPTATH